MGQQHIQCLNSGEHRIWRVSQTSSQLFTKVFSNINFTSDSLKKVDTDDGSQF